MNKKEFLLQLIGELSNSILSKEPNRMVISLHQEPEGMHICVLDDCKRTDSELEKMRHSLKQKNRPELSGYYGSMTGHDLFGSARLDLVGLQVKFGDVARTNEGTKIDIWLGDDSFDSTPFSIPE
jgi:hypothetical protein